MKIASATKSDLEHLARYLLAFNEWPTYVLGVRVDIPRDDSREIDEDAATRAMLYLTKKGLGEQAIEHARDEARRKP